MHSFRWTISPTFLALRLSQTRSVQLARASTTLEAKSINEIPTPKGLPLLGTTLEVMKVGNEELLFRRTEELHKKLGKIYRERLLGIGNLVFIGDPEIAEAAFRSQDAEATYPRRADMTMWSMIREELGEGDGVLTAENEEWKRLRTAFNKKMLRVQEVGHFASMVNETVTAFIKRIEYIQRQQPDQLTIPSLANEFYRFALETVAYVLFKRRLNCMEPDIPAATQQYIDSIGTMFRESNKLFILPHLHKRFHTAAYKKALEAWRIIFAMARRLIDDKIASVKDQLKTGSIDEPVDIVTHVLMSKQISEKEIYSNLTEILLAGVDTTSNTLVWMMYELAGNHDAQKKLRDEIDSVVGDRIATADDVKQLSYLKCCVKEVLRMYPVVPSNARMTKNDVVIGGYLIPKDTLMSFSHFAMSRNDDIFPTGRVVLQGVVWLRWSCSWQPSGWCRASTSSATETVCSPRSSVLFLFRVAKCQFASFRARRSEAVPTVRCRRRIECNSDGQIASIRPV